MVFSFWGFLGRDGVLLVFLSLSIISFYFYLYFFFCLNTVCEKSTMNLKCPPGKINIEYANYGRTDDNICTQKTSSKTDCRYENSEKIVKSQCDGKTYCSINALNSVFGDTCKNIRKYLEVKFTCI